MRKKSRKKRLKQPIATMKHSAELVLCGCCGKQTPIYIWIVFGDKKKVKFRKCADCAYKYTYSYSIDLARARKAAGKKIGLKKAIKGKDYPA